VLRDCTRQVASGLQTIATWYHASLRLRSNMDGMDACLWGFSRQWSPRLGLRLGVSATLGIKVPALPVGDNHMILCSLVLMHYQRVTDRRTDTPLLVKFNKHNQNYYLELDVSTSIRGFHKKKLVLSSSSSWHDGKTPCQESGRMRRSVGSSPSFLMCCVWPLWSIW